MRLNEWCEKNKLGYKILLADNVKNVNRLKRITNSTGVQVINLEGCRMVDLAQRIVIERYAQDRKLQKIEVVDPDFSVLLIYKLLNDETTDKYDFIPKECICMETAAELLRIVNIIRSGKKKPEYCKKGRKEEEQLKAIIADYEKSLREKGLYDVISLLIEATDIIKSGKVRIEEEIGIFNYMLPYLTYLEKEFLGALTTNPVGIDTVMLNKESIPVKCCNVYGQFNEIQKVINDISDNGYPFGKINIMYSSPEYENIIRMALSERSIPATFSSGYSVQDAPYISLLLALISWIESDYDYARFRSIADNEIVRLGNDYYFGVKTGIGWGLDRYKLFADQMNNNRDEYIDVLIKHGRLRESGKTEKEQGSNVKTCSDEFVLFVTDITEMMQKYGQGRVDTGQLYRDFISFIKDKTKGCESDKKTLTILEGLKGYFDLVGDASSLYEAISFITEKISSIKLSDDEKSNEVNVMQMGKIEVLERPYQYVIGMSYEAFGSKAVDSPVLPDERLECLVDFDEGYVEKSLERTIIKGQKFDATINTMPTGNLVLCACTYDTRNLREIALSNKFSEYSTEYNTESYGFPNVIKTDRNYTVDQNTLYCPSMEATTETDHYRFIKEESIDGNRHIILNRLSPSKLSNIMDCPWKYEYSIKYFENEPRERQVNVWLPADEKGNLFHQVFQEYCEQQLKNKVISESDIPDNEVLKRVFDRAIYEFELLVPKGSIQAFELEKETYFEQIRTYIEELYKEMSSTDKPWRVVDCEREFVTASRFINEDGEYCEPGNCDVIELAYHGFIDRVDSYCDGDGKEHFRVIDYKTGKKETLEDKLKTNQLQYVIYPMALSDEGKDVEYFEYVFPCDGNDSIQRTDIDDLPKACRERLASIFLKKELVDIDEESACKYCDYKDICVRRMNFVEVQ